MNDVMKDIIDLPIFGGNPSLLSRETGLSRGTVDHGGLTLRTRLVLIDYLEDKLRLHDMARDKTMSIITNLRNIRG